MIGLRGNADGRAPLASLRGNLPGNGLAPQVHEDYFLAASRRVLSTDRPTGSRNTTEILSILVTTI